MRASFRRSLSNPFGIPILLVVYGVFLLIFILSKEAPFRWLIDIFFRPSFDIIFVYRYTLLLVQEDFPLIFYEE